MLTLLFLLDLVLEVFGRKSIHHVYLVVNVGSVPLVMICDAYLLF